MGKQLTQRSQFTVFKQSTMASDIVVMILISAALYSTATCPKARDLSDEAKSITPKRHKAVSGDSVNENH